MELVPWPLGGSGCGLGVKTLQAAAPTTSVHAKHGLILRICVRNKPHSPGLIALVQESASFSLPCVPVLPSSVQFPPHLAQGTSIFMATQDAV